MIYNTLDILPYKTFVLVEKTGEAFRLNSNVRSEKDLSPQKIKALVEVWDNLYELHLGKNRSKESKNIFKLSKKIDNLICLSKVMVTACDCLRFQYNEEIHDIITNNGFILATDSTEKYYNSIDRIEREANNYLIKAEYYKNMLPDRSERNASKEESKFTVDDILASYSAILGISLGNFNNVSYNEYFAFQKQVENKIDSIKNEKA
jgi:hypothetical protein